MLQKSVVFKKFPSYQWRKWISNTIINLPKMTGFLNGVARVWANVWLKSQLHLTTLYHLLGRERSRGKKGIRKAGKNSNIVVWIQGLDYIQPCGGSQQQQLIHTNNKNGLYRLHLNVHAHVCATIIVREKEAISPRVEERRKGGGRGHGRDWTNKRGEKWWNYI